MIKSSDLIKLLKDKSIEFTKEELDKIIETELEKDESEMDTELIEICLDTLNEKKQVPSKKSKKTSYIKFALLAAAAVALIFANVAAFGKLNNNTPPVADKNDISSVTTENPETSTQESSLSATKADSSDSDSDSLEADITKKVEPPQKGQPTSSAHFNLKNQLEEYGFYDIVLPVSVLKNDKKISVNFSNNSALFSVHAYAKVLNVTISKSKTVDPETTEENTSSEIITVNGISVLVTNKNGTSTISYEHGSNQYKIVLNSTLEEATVIAKTLK